MRIGIVSQWRNQGQATLSRHLRDALDSLGHETFVLARPTRDEHVLPGAVDRDDVWAQPGVDAASRFEIPADEYLAWARRRRIEACFFNQNYQFAQLARLRAEGVANLGYFVWESFERADVAKARGAYDVVYSLNRATQARYARLGLDSPLLFWGVHPELVHVSAARERAALASAGARDASPREVRCFFPRGLLGPRKPLRAVVEAFRRTAGKDRDRLRLVLKAQLQSPLAEEYDRGGDPRIVEVVEDLPCAGYYSLFAGCDVCIGVSRWEGTGLHFFEAIAFGVPLIVNDVPPMNELVRDGETGMLVRSHVVGATKTEVPAVDPDVADLARAIESCADDATRARLAANQRKLRDAMPWRRTVDELAELLQRAGRVRKTGR